MVLRIKTLEEMCAIVGERVVIGFGNSNLRKLYHYEANDTNGSLQYLNQIVPNSTSNKANGLASLCIGRKQHRCRGENAYVNNMSSAGAIYLFDFNGSTPNQIARITASDGTSSDYLGSSVDMSGDLIVGGVSGEDIAGTAIAERLPI